MPLIQTAGRHDVTTSNTQFGESDNGKPFIQITYTTAAGEVITGWNYLTDDAFEKTVKTMRECFGFDGKFATLAEQVDGKPCSIVVETDNYNGKERLKVKWTNPIGGGGMKPAKPMSNIETRMAELSAKAARIPAAAPKAAAPRPAAARPAPVKAAAAEPADETAPF